MKWLAISLLVVNAICAAVREIQADVIAHETGPWGNGNTLKRAKAIHAAAKLIFAICNAVIATLIFWI